MAYCKICGEEYPDARQALGYRTCLEHPEPKKEFIVSIPFNKGPYQLITREEVERIGRS
jgi:hypothetical protein